MGHARALLGLPEAIEQERLCAEIVRQGVDGPRADDAAGEIEG